MPEKSNKLYSTILVITQFILIGAISVSALQATPGMTLVPALLLISIAIALAFSAIISLKMANFSVMPEPVRDGKLITSGPYRYIRHPMYTAVLSGCTGLLLLNVSLASALLLLALFAVLLLKIRREESLLNAAYSDYQNYRDQAGSLLPKLQKKTNQH